LRCLGWFLLKREHLLRWHSRQAKIVFDRLSKRTVWGHNYAQAKCLRSAKKHSSLNYTTHTITALPLPRSVHQFKQPQTSAARHQGAWPIPLHLYATLIDAV
jgi:hypothetical protein